MCVMALVVLVSPTLFGQHGGETSEPEIATVIGVHDGDTITVEFPDGSIEPIRFIGIEAPEVRGPKARQTQPYARLAQEYLATLVDLKEVGDGIFEGRKVLLERESYEPNRNRDRWERLLRHVFLLNEDGSRETSLNEAVIAAGYAEIFPYREDTRNATRFEELRDAAWTARLGMWKTKRKRAGREIPLRSD